MQLKNESRISLSADVVFQEITGEMVLLDLKSEQYYALDSVGTRIWELIDGQGVYGKLLEEMLDEFDVEESQLRDDLEKLLSRLHEEGLVVLSNP